MSEESNEFIYEGIKEKLRLIVSSIPDSDILKDLIVYTVEYLLDEDIMKIRKIIFDEIAKNNNYSYKDLDLLIEESLF
ncbi:hypothetical protein YN1_1380 [Nanoarchaeota archaeon]